jgi:hypothetical protein
MSSKGMVRMTDKERLERINENWGNYPTETTKGMTALCLDFEWLLEQAEKAQRYEKALNEICQMYKDTEKPVLDHWGMIALAKYVLDLNNDY